MVKGGKNDQLFLRMETAECRLVNKIQQEKKNHLPLDVLS
jgi:hypothetical protein